MPKKLKNLIKTVLRLVIGSAVAYYLIQMMLDKNEVDLAKELSTSVPWWIALAAVVYGVALVISALRWRGLLLVQGVVLSRWMAIRLMMIGVFFSLIIPGAVGGDVIKMVYVAKQTDEHKAEAVLTIFLDRIFGLLGLCVVAAVAILSSMDLVMAASRNLQIIIISVAGISVCGMLGVFVSAFHHQLMRLPGVRHLVAWGNEKLPEKLTGMVARLVRAIDMYRDHRMVLVKTLVLALGVHISITIAVICLANAFHQPDIAARHHLLATQAANTVGAVPLTPGGFGARDLALSGFLEQAGAAKEKAGIIAPMLTMIIILWSLIGGIFFLFAPVQKDTIDDIDPEAMLEEAEHDLAST